MYDSWFSILHRTKLTVYSQPHRRSCADNIIMDSPVNGVFDTYELLERILLKLSTKAIFGVQRVAPAWKDLIGRSHSLQRRMFLMADREPLTPEVTSKTHLIHNAYLYRLRINPMSKFLAPRDARTEFEDFPSDGIAHWRLGRMYRNHERTERLRYEATWQASRAAQLYKLPPSATCKDMFLTQPPIRALSVCLSPSHLTCTLFNQRGITFRDALQGFEKFKRNAEEHGHVSESDSEWFSFYFSWPIESHSTSGTCGQCDLPKGMDTGLCASLCALFDSRA